MAIDSIPTVHVFLIKSDFPPAKVVFSHKMTFFRSFNDTIDEYFDDHTLLQKIRG